MSRKGADKDFKKAPDGNADRGEEIYKQTCAKCHAVKPNATGPDSHGPKAPNLWGLFGRRSGRLPDFPRGYSNAIKLKGTIWNEETLYLWLENPQRYIQGTKMDFEGLQEPQDRADVIEYLKKATGPPVRTNERGEAAGRYGNHG